MTRYITLRLSTMMLNALRPLWASACYGCVTLPRTDSTASAPCTRCLCSAAGHVPDIMGAKGPWSFVKWTATYGRLYKLLFLDEFVVVVLDPDTIASVTRRTGKSCSLLMSPYTAADGGSMHPLGSAIKAFETAASIPVQQMLLGAEPRCMDGKQVVALCSCAKCHSNPESTTQVPDHQIQSSNLCLSKIDEPLPLSLQAQVPTSQSPTMCTP